MSELIIRTGIDLEKVSRVMDLKESIRSRFVKRIFTPAEMVGKPLTPMHITGLFCAKEAVAKALGCGIGPISWQDIEIGTESGGSPSVLLTGDAHRLATEIGIIDWSVSITHTREYAAAVAVGYGQK